MTEKKLYVCIGCYKVHYDSDYSERDGDLLIDDWKRFLESVEKIKKQIGDGKCQKQKK